MAKRKGNFRSGFELDVYEASLKGTKSKYESLRIPYVTEHKYTPDWVLPNGIIVEIKGRFTSFDRAKHLQIKQQHPQLDIRFIFKYDNKLYKESKTRYSDWCTKNGFIYAWKVVPEEWLLEKKRDIVFGVE